MSEQNELAYTRAEYEGMTQEYEERLAQEAKEWHDKVAKCDTLQEQLATQKSYAGDLLLDKLAREKDVARLTEERDALQERLREVEEAARLVVDEWTHNEECTYCDEEKRPAGEHEDNCVIGQLEWVLDKRTYLGQPSHNLIVKLAKYTGDVVGTMKEVMEIVGDDDGPTADYGPAFCQLKRDGQRLLDEAYTYLGEPSPEGGNDAT